MLLLNIRLFSDHRTNCRVILYRSMCTLPLLNWNPRHFSCVIAVHWREFCCPKFMIQKRVLNNRKYCRWLPLFTFTKHNVSSMSHCVVRAIVQKHFWYLRPHILPTYKHCRYTCRNFAIFIIGNLVPLVAIGIQLVNVTISAKRFQMSNVWLLFKHHFPRRTPISGLSSWNILMIVTCTLASLMQVLQRKSAIIQQLSASFIYHTNSQFSHV